MIWVTNQNLLKFEADLPKIEVAPCSDSKKHIFQIQTLDHISTVT